MKTVFRGISLISLLSTSVASAQIVGNTHNLFTLRKWNRAIRQSNKARVNIENIAAISKFKRYDVQKLGKGEHVRDIGEPQYLNYKDALSVLKKLRGNPVAAMHRTSKYDPDNRGIGYCFGRAMFTHLELSHREFSRKSIKKAFVVGTMTTGGNSRWGWHVTTIAQSKDEYGREIWLALDPVTGTKYDRNGKRRPYTLTEWYKTMLKDFSVDGLLKLYITEPTRFGPSGGSYNARNLANNFYHNYFIDMEKWFDTQSRAGKYGQSEFIKPFK